MLDHFKKQGKASFIMGGQFGSEGKGAAAAFTAVHLAARREAFDIVTTNAGAQAGHTSTHNGVTKVVFHLPTAALYPMQHPMGLDTYSPLVYLNAGSVIDPVGLLRELDENPVVTARGRSCFAIHPNAAIITPDCRGAEMHDDSAQTKIASTRKGVGEALSRKVLRSGFLAKDLVRPVHWFGPEIHRLQQYVRRIDLNEQMQRGASVLVEVPQGHSLSIDGPFYPHVTSRNCTVGQAMSDAGIHPHFYHQSMMVIRTFPIRVGNIPVSGREVMSPIVPDDERGEWPLVDGKPTHSSGPHFPDQREISWDELGVKAEITTVTKRVRRVFTFSEQQVMEAIAQTRPAVIYLTFCDYLPTINSIDDQAGKYAVARLMVDRLCEMCNRIGSVRHDGPEILTQWGPTTSDVIRAEDI